MNDFKRKIMMERLEAIDYYINERKWPVFPCNPNKRPYTENGFHDATTDWKQAVKWWKQFPTANIGVPTGEISGFWVLDLDEKDGKSGMQSMTHWNEDWINGLDTAKLMQKTPSGGFHILYEYKIGHPLKTGSDILGVNSGVDVRTNGGYILVAPSSININDQWVEYRWNDSTSEYQINPDWIDDLANISSGRKWIDSDIPNAFSDGIPEGKRDDVLFRIACRLRYLGVHIDEARLMVEWLAIKKCRPAFDTDLALEKVESAYSYKDDKKGYKRFL